MILFSQLIQKFLIVNPLRLLNRPVVRFNCFATHKSLLCAQLWLGSNDSQTNDNSGLSHLTDSIANL